MISHRDNKSSEGVVLKKIIDKAKENKRWIFKDGAIANGAEKSKARKLWSHVFDVKDEQDERGHREKPRRRSIMRGGKPIKKSREKRTHCEPRQLI